MHIANHLPAEEVPHEFATEVVNVLTPGIKELLKEDYDRANYKRLRGAGAEGGPRVKKERN
jgi:hypothetical protein